MINAAELRLNNWILDKDNTPRQVSYIGDTIGLINSAGGTDKYQSNPIISNDINDLKYIPLTEELLLKAGFEWVSEMIGYADKLHCIIIDVEGYAFLPFCTNDKDCEIKIKYLHDLQNLVFSMTKTELNINL